MTSARPLVQACVGVRANEKHTVLSAGRRCEGQHSDAERRHSEQVNLLHGRTGDRCQAQERHPRGLECCGGYFGGGGVC